METINKKSFILHLDSLDVLNELTDEQAGKLFKAIYNFNCTGETPDFKDLLKVVFMPFQKQFIRDFEKYEKQVLKNRENGKLGGRPEKQG